MTNQRPVRRPTDCWHDFILQEYRRLTALPDPVVSIELQDDDSPHFSCRLNTPTRNSRSSDRAWSGLTCLPPRPVTLPQRTNEVN